MTLNETPENKKKTNLLELIIRDKIALHAHYMPFIKGGGLFIPTNKNFQLGEPSAIVVRFLDRGKKLVISGKVVWVSPQGSPSEAQGVGIQFGGSSQIAIKQAIEGYLGDLAYRPSLQQVY